MTFEEMKQRLTSIQNDSAETKMLNSILICFAEIKNLEKGLVDTQNKINEIINALNSTKENAETVNTEIKEDNSQSNPIEQSTGSADSSNESEKQ